MAGLRSVVVVAVVVVASLAALGSARADEVLPGQMPNLPPRPLAEMFSPDDPVLAAAKRQEEERRRREIARLDSPAAEEAREDSQDAFADLSDRGAVSLARSTFGDELTGPTEAVSELPDGLRISDYRDQYTGVVETATGLPDAGISFVPVGAESVTAEQRSDRLIYPSIETDTDYIVQPTEPGAESFRQLRSADSPDTLRLRFTLPAGAALEDRSLSGQSIAAAVVKDDGTVLATIKPVAATDAAGRPVEISSEVDGSDLIIRADIRDPDVQLPVLLDPDIVTEAWYGEQVRNCGAGSASQAWWREDNYPSLITLSCDVNNPLAHRWTDRRDRATETTVGGPYLHHLRVLQIGHGQSGQRE